MLHYVLVTIWSIYNPGMDVTNCCRCHCLAMG
jgi:hypothetical protein